MSPVLLLSIPLHRLVAQRRALIICLTSDYTIIWVLFSQETVPLKATKESSYSQRSRNLQGTPHSINNGGKNYEVYESIKYMGRPLLYFIIRGLRFLLCDWQQCNVVVQLHTVRLTGVILTMKELTAVSAARSHSEIRQWQ